METSLRIRDGYLTQNWYIACLSSELKHLPIQRIIYDTKIVLFRSKNYQAFALLDKCLHRHALLSKGKVIDGEIMCPYHGWKFDGAGLVTEIPSEGPSKITSTRRCQESFKTIERDGVIWIWMGDNNAEMSNQKKQEQLWNFPHVGENGWVHYFMVTDFNNEATNLIENFMDVPHTVWVHKGWFRNKSITKVPMTVESKNGGVKVTYHQAKDQIGVLIRPLLNPKGEPMVHTDHFIFPNITCVDYSFGKNYKYVINSQITPVSEMQSRVYTYIAYRIPLVGTIMKKFIQFYTRKVIEQDVWIMDVQRKNLNPNITSRFQSTAADEPHLQIERMRSGGVKGHDIYSIEKKVETTIWL